MVRVILLFESTCSNCGAKAKFCCSNCGKALCGRCITKEKKNLVTNIIIPEGLCKSCSDRRILEYNKGSFNTLSEAITIYVPDPFNDNKIIDNS